MLYNSLILPHFTYCATLWCNTTKSNINRLNLLQNRAMRIILRCNYRTHINDMLNKLHFLNVENHCKLQIYILMHKIFHNLVPEYLNFPFLNINFNDYNLRSKSNNNLFVSRNHSSSLWVKGVKLWNDLPGDIKHSNSLTKFKNKVNCFIWDTMD